MSARPRSVRPRPHRLAFVAVAGSLALAGVHARAAGLDDAQYVTQSGVPSTLYCGQTANVSITMRNSGTSTWLSTTYRLRSASTTTWGIAADGVPLGSNVAPAASATFNFVITAPSVGGTYDFRWQMSNGVTSFGSPSPTVSIPVFCEGANGYRTGYRELGGSTLNALFTDGAHVEEDTSFSSPLYSHVETSTVYYGGRYLMYHRHPDLSIKGVALQTSTDGHTWTPYAGGARIYGDNTISSPNVMVDKDANNRPRLTMVFECASCGAPSGKVAVGRSYSYDGVNWSPRAAVVVPSTSGDDGVHTGTPNVVRTPDGLYRVGYHMHPSTGVSNYQFLKVGFAHGTTLDSLLTKPTSGQLGNGTPNPAGWWAKAGVGKRDIVKEGAYWYMLIEGFRGDVNCPAVGTITSWALARTTDPTFATGWQFSPLSPIRIDLEGHKCGEDMPSFQIVNGVPYIVTTGMYQLTGAGDGGNDALTPVKRYKIVTGPRGKINSEVVAMARTSDGGGYYEVTAAGHVYAYGNATFHGSPAPTSGVVGIAAKPGGGGYWLVTANGVVYNYGSAAHHGQPYPLPLVKPVVGIAATPSGNGYWLVAGDGGVFNYGDAPLHGSMGGKALNAPVVGMAATSNGGGYWLVASDGGIFAFGNASFKGSMGGRPLNQPVVGIAAGPDDGGYWLLGKDGGVFAFPEGAYPYAGSTLGLLPDMPNETPAHAVAIVPTPSSVGYGYWILFKNGSVLDLGPARYRGDPVFG